MKNAAGMTLIEVLAALLVLTLLVTAMGTSLELGLETWERLRFASQSEALADILQAALEDVLIFAEEIGRDADGNVRFSNLEYGVTEGCLTVEEGRLYLSGRSLVAPGVYGGLWVEKAELVFLEQTSGDPTARTPLLRATLRLTDGTATTTRTFLIRPLGKRARCKMC